MPRDAVAGRLLVAAQFALIAWLIWPLTPQRWSLPALALVGCALVLGLWTLVHNRPSNFNIRPEPEQCFSVLVCAFATRHDGTVRRPDAVFAMPATNPILFVQ